MPSRRSVKRHPGAWKVAYADFATATMALFIVLWLLGLPVAIGFAGTSFPIVVAFVNADPALQPIAALVLVLPTIQSAMMR